jgi:F-type H+-transporting ATPase subunit c
MKALQCAFLVLLVALVMVSPAMAQEAGGGPGTGVRYAASWGAAVGAGLGAGLTIIGAGFGLGWMGASALQSMARQPEVAGRIQTAMIVIAALLEGVTFFSLIVCIILQGHSVFSLTGG